MVDLNSEFIPRPPYSRRTVALPRSFRDHWNRHNSGTSHQGVHVYRVVARATEWSDERYRQAMIVMFLPRSRGAVRWRERDGTWVKHAVRPGDAWFVAPGVAHGCEFERTTHAVALFLEPWRLEEGLAEDYARIVGTSSVDRFRRFDSAFKALRPLREYVFAVQEENYRGSYPENKLIQAALALTLLLWQIHFWNLRVTVDGQDADELLRSLKGTWY